MTSFLRHIMTSAAFVTLCATAHGEQAELVPRVPRVGGEPLVLSHDGRLLATFWNDHLYLWDTVRGLPIRSLECSRRTIKDLPKAVKAVASNEIASFSPDGRYVAATVTDYPKRLRDGFLSVPCVWDLESGRSLTAGTWRYVSNPNGEPSLEHFPFGLSEPWLWRTTREDLSYYAIEDATSADGRFAARLIPKEGKISIQVQNLMDGQSLGSLELGKTQRVASLVFSPKGRWLVSEDFNYERWRLIVWDIETGARHKTLNGDRGFSGIAFSPDGRWLSLAKKSEVLKVYELTTWESIWSHPSIDGFHLDSVAFSPNGKIFAITHEYEPIIEIWQTDDEWSRRVLFDTLGLVPVTSLALDPNGQKIAVGSYEAESGMEPSVYNYSGLTGLWSLQSRGAPLRLKEDMSIRGLAFGRDGKRLATASQDETQEGRSSGTLDGQVRLWDVETAKSRVLLNGGQRVWSTPTQEGPDAEDGVDLITVSESSATKVAFIPRSGELVAGVYQLSAETWEGITWVEFESVVHLTFWDPQSGTELKSIDTERSELHAMAVDPDGKILATGHELGQLLLWDISTGEKLHEVPSERADRMSAVAFHPDGSVLVSGDSEGRLVVWNPLMGDELRRLSDHPEGVADIAFNATGDLLASASCDEYGSRNGRTRLRDTSSFEVLFELKGCPTVVLFTPDSRFLIVGDRDGVTRFYEVETGQLVVSLALHPNIDAWLVWTPDGLYDGNAEGIERILVWRRGKDVGRLTDFSSRYHVANLLPKALSGTLDRPERPITELSAPK